jgi:hypothetical protein
VVNLASRTDDLLDVVGWLIAPGAQDHPSDVWIGWRGWRAGVGRGVGAWVSAGSSHHLVLGRRNSQASSSDGQSLLPHPPRSRLKPDDAGTLAQMVESQSSLFGGEGSSDSSSSASAITRRRVQRLFSPTAATDDASRTVPSSAMTSTSVAGPGPSTVAAAKEAAHEVVELDDSSSDSELELISAGYGPWHELLPTNPAVCVCVPALIALA